MPVVTDNLLGAYLRDRRTRLDPAAFGFGQQGIGRVGQHAVQRVAGFVKQGARLVVAQQAGLPCPAAREIHDVDDDRPDLAVEPALGLRCHALPTSPAPEPHI
jgi:hypothetical protein